MDEDRNFTKPCDIADTSKTFLVDLKRYLLYTHRLGLLPGISWDPEGFFIALVFGEYTLKFTVPGIEKESCRRDLERNI